MSICEIQWVFIGLFNYYALQPRCQSAPCAFDKASYFRLACISVKWERVKLIDRGSAEMMYFCCDCFHSHYSQHGVISGPPADTSACASVTEPSPRRVRLPLAAALIFDFGGPRSMGQKYRTNGLSCASPSLGPVSGRKSRRTDGKDAGGLSEIWLKFCLLEVVVVPLTGVLGVISLSGPRPARNWSLTFYLR